MGDFCIMVDLAQAVAIPGVEPLGKDTVEHLREFLETEPWHSLLVDNDVTVAHTGVRLPDDVLALVANLVHSNAARLGVRPPPLI